MFYKLRKRIAIGWLIDCDATILEKKNGFANIELRHKKGDIVVLHPNEERGMAGAEDGLCECILRFMGKPLEEIGMLVKKRIKVSYVGRPNDDSDKTIMEAMKGVGARWYAQGYDFVNNERDICFDILVKDE